MDQGSLSLRALAIQVQVDRIVPLRLSERLTQLLRRSHDVFDVKQRFHPHVHNMVHVFHPRAPFNYVPLAVSAHSALRSAAALDPKKLRAEHEAAWAQRIDAAGSVHILGDLALAQAVNASQYTIRTEIRTDGAWSHGLSPGGISTNGYHGANARSAPLPHTRALRA